MPLNAADLSGRWVQHQRRNHKTTQFYLCPVCPEHFAFQSPGELNSHALDKHPSEMPAAVADQRSKYNSSPKKQPFNKTSGSQPEPQAKRPLAESPGGPSRSLSAMQGLNLDPSKDSEDIAMPDMSDDSHDKQPRKRAAVGDGISAGSGSETPSPPPEKSRSPDSDLQRPHVSNKQLWTPERIPIKRPPRAAPASPPPISSSRAPKQLALQPRNENLPGTVPVNSAGLIQIASKPRAGQTQEGGADDTSNIIREPETRPISHEQLVAEVKGIYAGLVMVEAKCIEVDNKQSAFAQGDPALLPKLNNEQWQALIALHRTLLHEHHDFFLASQHPSASPALRRLASKYAMPARMWRHGIHSFLELLRHRLPASLDHMLAFIYLAYSIMALLYETVPAFEDTWIECLGDLGRYRMAIEDDDVRDREVWTSVARHWYSKASDKSPATGRLYHHLAILARPNAIQQVFYYSKSLCVAIPFPSARESILTLFDPVLNAAGGQGQYRLPPFDMAFVKSHALLFTNKNIEKFQPAVQEFLDLLDPYVGRVTRKFLEQGYCIAISNIIAMLGYAAEDNPLMRGIKDMSQDVSGSASSGVTVKIEEKSMKAFLNAEHFAIESLKIILRRLGDPNVLPFVHSTLVFMYFMTRYPRAMQHLEVKFPWQPLTEMLNLLLASYPTLDRIENTSFPLPVKGHVHPFTEDRAMQGLIWADGYFPETWFANDKIDDEEKHLEVASMAEERKERILWLACRIANAGSWISYDRDSRQFSATFVEVPALDSRVSTFQSEASMANNDRLEELVDVKIEVKDGSYNEYGASSRCVNSTYGTTITNSGALSQGHGFYGDDEPSRAGGVRYTPTGGSKNVTMSRHAKLGRSRRSAHKHKYTLKKIPRLSRPGRRF